MNSNTIELLKRHSYEQICQNIDNSDYLKNTKNPSIEKVGFGKYQALTMLELAVHEESYFNWAIHQVEGFAFRVANKEFIKEVIAKRRTQEAKYKEHLSYSLRCSRGCGISYRSSYGDDWDSNTGCGNTIF